jgi:hypothetical protein
LVRSRSGWRPVGRFRRVLEAAAAARAMLAAGPADPEAAGFATPRLVFGCLGTTGQALDLNPGGDGYRARLMGLGKAAAEVAEYLLEAAVRLCGATPTVAAAGTGVGAGGAGVGAGARFLFDGPSGPTPPEATAAHSGGVWTGPSAQTNPRAVPSPGSSPAVTDLHPRWSRIAALLMAGVPVVRVEAASISQPTGPMLQQRLSVISTQEGYWVLLGTQEGDRSGRSAARAGAISLAGVLGNVLRGSAANLAAG